MFFFSDFNSTLATGSGDNSVRLFTDINGPHALKNPDKEVMMDIVCSIDTAHEGDVNCVHWSPSDPTILLSAGDDNLIQIWRFSSY